MEQPFGFIKGFQMDKEAKSRAEERETTAEENRQKNLTNWELPKDIAARMDALEKQEKLVEEKVDVVINAFAKKAGYDSVPWFTLTWVVIWIYTVLTLFVMMNRPDFFNLTICTVALYMMFNTDRITKTRFKILVFGIFITLIYDFVWFMIKHQEYAEEYKQDGSNEISIRRFCLIMSYVSFIVRVRL